MIVLKDLKHYTVIKVASVREPQAFKSLIHIPLSREPAHNRGVL